jgi:pyrroloquinoline-quinone synthase
MHPDETIRSLDEMIQSRSILTHPFYVAWQRGDLTREQLATYATFYYPHVAAFPGYLERARNRAANSLVRSEIENNLADELGNPARHSELWLDFAEELGVDRETVATAQPRPAAAAVVDTFNARASGDTAGALAALYAYESQQPEVSKQKLAGLRESYGVTSPKALAYFEVHAEADIHHSEGERQAITRCLADGASPEGVLESASDALDAYWGLLDGICEEAQIRSC